HAVDPHTSLTRQKGFKVDDFYAARSRTIPPLPWSNIAPPFSVLFLYDTCALPQVVAIAIELSTIWLLVRWHADLTDADSWQSGPHSY
ncbi:hypothetical protein, partial [Sphingobium cupriresistens]|uniref:hypothetical protein n=1 Tax=Sphingobium cupriresistens TaxID=1132417 RepID=UPI001A916F00